MFAHRYAARALALASVTFSLLAMAGCASPSAEDAEVGEQAVTSDPVPAGVEEILPVTLDASGYVVDGDEIFYLAKRANGPGRSVYAQSLSDRSAAPRVVFEGAHRFAVDASHVYVAYSRDGVTLASVPRQGGAATTLDILPNMSSVNALVIPPGTTHLLVEWSMDSIRFYEQRDRAVPWGERVPVLRMPFSMYEWAASERGIYANDGGGLTSKLYEATWDDFRANFATAQPKLVTEGFYAIDVLPMGSGGDFRAFGYRNDDQNTPSFVERRGAYLSQAPLRAAVAPAGTIPEDMTIFPSRFAGEILAIAPGSDQPVSVAKAARPLVRPQRVGGKVYYEELFQNGEQQHVRVLAKTL